MQKIFLFRNLYLRIFSKPNTIQKLHLSDVLVVVDVDSAFEVVELLRGCCVEKFHIAQVNAEGLNLCVNVHPLQIYVTNTCICNDAFHWFF